jgi:hypothetical protein
VLPGLEVPPLLATPPIAFPRETHEVSVRSLTRAQKLAAALRVCRRKPKHARRGCERSARAKYGPVRKAKSRAKRK